MGGSFFHGYYDSYCFLPLYVFCGEQLLVSYLRPSKIDGAKHAWAILSLLVKQLRKVWHRVKIIFRGDSGFCRHKMLLWCEKNEVDYVVGLAKNKRLNASSQDIQRGLNNPVTSRGCLASFITLPRLGGEHGASSPRPNIRQKDRIRAISSALSQAIRSGYMITSIAPGVTWRTGSRNNNSTCSPIVPVAINGGPISFD